MRHEPVDSERIAAAWPATFEGLRLAEPAPAEPAQATPESVAGPAAAVPDVAPGVGGLIVAAYAGLLGVFFAFFARSPEALFAITICAFFVATFFTVPRLFLAVEADPSRRPTLDAFLAKGLDTLTGRSSGRDALVQMLIVPVFLTLGLLAIGIVGRVYL